MSLIAPRRVEQADEAELDEEHNQTRLRSARAELGTADSERLAAEGHLDEQIAICDDLLQRLNVWRRAKALPSLAQVMTP